MATQKLVKQTIEYGDATLRHVAKLGIVEDKPVMYDYWAPSCDESFDWCS